MRWLTIPVNYIQWVAPIKRVTLNVLGEQDTDFEQASKYKYAIFSSLNGNKYSGQTKINVDIANIIIDKPIRCLLMIPYPDLE
jgi:hypothetical protein